MSDKDKQTTEKKKGFFSKMFEKLDKSMEEKANKSSCCGGDDKKDGSSCC